MSKANKPKATDGSGAAAAPALAPEPVPSAHATTIPQASATSEAERQSFDLFKMQLQQTWNDRQSSADAYDKNLMAISSGALALSLAIIKDFVPYAEAHHGWTLLASWLCFVLCMAFTTASYIFSQNASDLHQQFLQSYQRTKDPKLLNPPNKWAGYVSRCGEIAGVALIVGVLLTVFFVFTNLKDASMSKKSSTTANDLVVGRVEEARTPVNMTSVMTHDARTPCAMAEVGNTVERGRTPAAMVPATTPQQQQTGGSNQQQQGSGNKGSDILKK